jgi:hypothetical protein
MPATTHYAAGALRTFIERAVYLGALNWAEPRRHHHRGVVRVSAERQLVDSETPPLPRPPRGFAHRAGGPKSPPWRYASS